VLTITIGTSTGFVGKGKVYEIMAIFVLLLMGSGSSLGITTNSFQELVATIVACIGEIF
jgi:hypothetical protein